MSSWEDYIEKLQEVIQIFQEEGLIKDLVLEGAKDTKNAESFASNPDEEAEDYVQENEDDFYKINFKRD